MITVEMVEDLLFKMGLPLQQKGFDFVVDAILMLDQNNGHVDWMTVYDVISVKRNAKEHTVRRHLQYAVNYLRDNPQSDEGYLLVEKYIGFNESNASTALSRMHRIMCREHKEDVIQKIDEEYLRNMIRSVIKEMIVSA